MLDDMNDRKTSYEPYKYVMSDVGNIYIGARYTYEELLSNDDVNFKLKAIISHYILKDSDITNSLESEFYHMKPGSNVYSVFEQLKVRAHSKFPTHNHLMNYTDLHHFYTRHQDYM